MRCVSIESPFAGNEEDNLRYLRACMHDCLLRSEAPFAMHALYTQEGVLDDEIPEQRRLGMDAGFEISSRLDATVVYTDLGVSKGMKEGIERALDDGRPVEYRSLPNWNLDLNSWTLED